MDSTISNFKQIIAGVFLCFAVITPMYSQSGNSPQTLAILEIEGSGVTDDFLDLVKQSLEEAFYNIDGFDVIEREKIMLVISEQQFQLSGMVDEETAVEIGELLAADMVVTISVTRLTDVVLTVKFLNVKTGAVVFIETHPLKKQDDIKPVARKVARGVEKAVFPSRYLPSHMVIYAGAGATLPVGSMNDLVTVGGGGHAGIYLHNIFMNYLDAGFEVEYLYSPGKKDGAAEWYQFIPVTFSAGYRFPFADRFYLRPQLWTGILIGLASIDPDGYVVGLEDPEFSTYNSFYYIIAAGFSSGIELNSLLVEMSLKYSLTFGDSEPIMKIPFGLSLGWYL